MHRRAFAPLFLLALALLPLPATAGIDRWTPVGPDTGVVRVLAAAPSRPAVVYAGLVSGGVYRSLDGGSTWTLASGGIDVREQINALAVDPRLPGRVWAATDSVIYRSTDGGAHWVSVRDGGALVLAVDPAVPGTVYASLGDITFQRSLDAGATWTTLAGSPAGIEALAIDPAHPQTLYAGTSSGFFVSRNRGASWQPSDRGLPASPFVLSVAVDPRSPRTIYLATSGVGADQIVFRSDNGGVSWTAVDQGRLGPTYQVAVDPGKSGAVWAVTAFGLFRSLDHGRTWSHSGAGLPPVYQVITVLPGATLLAGTGAGVFQGANRGVSWSSSSSGILAANLQGLALDPLRPLRLWSLDWAGNVYRTTSGGGQWALLPALPNFSITGPLASDPNGPGVLYAGVSGGSVLRSADAGNHWTLGSPLNCFEPLAIAVDPRDSSVVYTAGDPAEAGCVSIPDLCGIFRSDDSGAHWSCIGGGAIGGFASLVVPDPVQAGAVYAAIVAGNVYRSTDRGGSWALLSAQPGITALTADPHVAGRLWAGGSFGVHRSDDGGVTWTPDGAGLPTGAPVAALALDPVDPNVAYAATTRNGVFKTTDAGATWTSLGPGLAGSTVGFLALDPRTRTTLYAGTRERGVFKLEIAAD